MCDADNSFDTSEANNIESKDDFTYLDNNDCLCRIQVMQDGIIVNKKSDSYNMELNLTNNSYCILTTSEGEIKFDVKVVDFNKKNDILVMRYVINDIERKIEINYRS